MRRRTMLLFVCTFLVIFFGAARIFYLSQSEKLKAKDLAVEIAAQKVQFTKITDFYWFNTEETYYSLAGITTEGQPLYAIVSPDKKEVPYYNRMLSLMSKKHDQSQNKRNIQMRF